jgi:hypothetical protein
VTALDFVDAISRQLLQPGVSAADLGSAIGAQAAGPQVLEAEAPVAGVARVTVTSDDDSTTIVSVGVRLVPALPLAEVEERFGPGTSHAKGPRQVGWPASVVLPARREAGQASLLEATLTSEGAVQLLTLRPERS